MPRAHLLLVLCICFAWGGNFLASASALRHFAPFQFTALRLLVVLVVLAPALGRVPRDQWPRLGVIALTTGGLHFAVVFWALAAAGDISSVAIALQSYVPMSALLAAALLGERVPALAAAGIALAFGGVLVLGFDPLVLDAPGSLLLTLLAASLLATGTVLMRGLRGVNAFQLQGWSALLGVPLLAVAALVWEPPLGPALTTASALDWAGVGYSAIGASVIGHGLVYWLVQRHPVSQVTPFLLLTPVVAVSLGVLVWGDRPGPRLIVGGLMVLGGVLLVARPRKLTAPGTG